MSLRTSRRQRDRPRSLIDDCDVLTVKFGIRVAPEGFLCRNSNLRSSGLEEEGADVPLISIILISLVDSSVVKSFVRCPELDERSRILEGGFRRSYIKKVRNPP